MKLADRRTWKSAHTLRDLGNLMADWLEGRIRTWPGYCDTKPDPETTRLIPVLAACCRAGYVTTGSQPGEHPERGYDGRMWRQRAWVDGWIADGPLLATITAGARRNGITAITHRPGAKSRDYMPITEADGECNTGVGHFPGHRKMIASEWPGIGRDALDELRAATHLTLVDPVWGRNDVLWPMLRAAVC